MSILDPKEGFVFVIPTTSMHLARHNTVKENNKVIKKTIKH